MKNQKQIPQSEAPKVEYSLKLFKLTYQKLLTLSKTIDSNSKLLICEYIEMLSQYSVWGDANDSDFFDYFFEENIAENLFKIMQRSPFKEITISVIQSFSILMANLSKKDNITYLLSHPVMKDLIVYNYDFTEEEIVDYYISLLKSLALRIDDTNIQLFFNQRMSYFPLLWQAIKFYNHKEIMVRTAVRTVVLGIMKIKYDKLKEYFTHFPFVVFYLHLACYLKAYLLDFNSEIVKGIADRESFNDLTDMFYFIADLYSFCPEAAELLDNSLLTYNLIPALFGGILYQRKDTLTITFGLYIANQFLALSPASTLAKSLTLLFFSPKIQCQLNQLYEQNIRQPRSFMYTWSFKNFWDQHLDMVIQQANNLFDIDPIQVNENHECRDELAIIHDVLGLRGAIGVTLCCQKLLKVNDEKLITNRVREQLFQYLLTKDDNFLFLLLNLWKNVLYNSSPEILRQCLFQSANTQDIIDERNYILKHLLKVFQIDPPLRSCTYILVTQVVLYFLKADKFVIAQETQESIIESYQCCAHMLLTKSKQASYNEQLTQLYSLERQKYSENIIQLKPSLDYLAFIQEVDQRNPDIDLIYRRPEGIKETALRDLGMFLMVEKIVSTMQQQNNPDEQANDNPTNRWVVGKNYEPPNREMLSCRICAKTVRDKLQQCKSEECFWISDEENFIIVETQIVQKDWAKLLYLAKLKDVEVTIDRGEPRILNVSIKIQNLQSIKEQYQDVQLYFDDYTYALKTKKQIDETRREFSRKSQQQIEKVIQKALHTCIEFYKNGKL